MSNMKKHVVVGVTGGIASYKVLDVISRLKKQDIDITVIMTQNACEFINPLSFQTISKNYVVTDTFQAPKAWDVEHVELAKKADLILIAPATANCIGKIASGIADDMLTTTIMAAKKPVMFVPSMNTNMYENPIFNMNMTKLKSLGYFFFEPESGLLACGDVGKGRLPEPEAIVKRVVEFLSQDLQPKDLINRKILVTAGPTAESIDPVRYMTNHSSGKMGFSIAEQAIKRGADVVLVAGPVNLSCSEKIKRVDVRSTENMRKSVNDYFEWADIVIMAAAPADYRPMEEAKEKIKKHNDDLTLKLVKNPDILRELGTKKGSKILIGFAAETNNLIEYAKGKIEKKNLDVIVANDVKQEGAGFMGDTNIITIIDRKGNTKSYEKMSKLEAADIILDKAKEYIRE